MELLQLEIGVEGGTINQKYNHLHKLAVETWLTHTWKFMGKIGVNIAGLPE